MKIFIVIKIVIAYIISFFFIFERKTRWIIGSKCGEGFEDNGASFYVYLKSKHNIKKNFVIKKEYINYDNKCDNSINYLKMSSIKSYLYFFRAKYVLFTHTPHSDICPLLPFLPIINRSLNRKVLCNLKHGVTALKKVKLNVDYKKNLKNKILKMYKKYSYVIACSDREADFLVSNGFYSKEQIVVTGFSRFDFLNAPPENNEKYILLSLTWRDWIKSQKDFNDSNYKKKIIELLDSQQLKTLLGKHNIKLVFLPHMFISKYIDLTSYENEKCIILKNSNDVAKYIKEANVLITDFSSVIWDAIYMNKPVIQYLIEKEVYMKTTGAYIDLDELKPIQSESVDSLIKMLENIIVKDENYAAKLNSNLYFKYVDKDNSARIFNALVNHERSK